RYRGSYHEHQLELSQRVFDVESHQLRVAFPVLIIKSARLWAGLLILISGAFPLSALASHSAVILISVDTLRADHLGPYGYRRIRTPNLDRLARGGTVFSHVDSPVPMTLPAHTSLLTSTYPSV